MYGLFGTVWPSEPVSATRFHFPDEHQFEFARRRSDR